MKQWISVMDALDSTAFARIEIKPEEIPISWDRALALLEKQREGYNRLD